MPNRVGGLVVGWLVGLVGERVSGWLGLMFRCISDLCFPRLGLAALSAGTPQPSAKKQFLAWRLPLGNVSALRAPGPKRGKKCIPVGLSAEWLDGLSAESSCTAGR